MKSIWKEKSEPISSARLLPRPRGGSQREASSSSSHLYNHDTPLGRGSPTGEPGRRFARPTAEVDAGVGAVLRDDGRRSVRDEGGLQWPYGSRSVAETGKYRGPCGGPWRNPTPSPTQYSLTPDGRIVMRKIMTASRRHGGDERVGPQGLPPGRGDVLNCQEVISPSSIETVYQAASIASTA